MTQNNTDILTIGGATLDIMLTTDEYDIIDNSQDLKRQKLIAFEYGAKLITKDACMTYGGGAANSAINLSNLDFAVTALVQLGDDSPGRDIKFYLENRGINTDYIIQHKNTFTGTSVIVSASEAHDHVAFVNRGANAFLDISKETLAIINPQHIYLTSLSGERALDNLIEIFDYIRENNIPITWNPGSQQVQMGCEALKRFLQYTTILHVNKDEAIEMLYSSGEETDNVEDLLKRLHAEGPRLVTITCGADGAWSYDGEKIYFQSALDVEHINTTGAGDAFGSTFLAAYIKTGGDIGYALAAGVVNSSEVIKKVGAQHGLVGWTEITNIIKEHSLV